jgi:DNA-binding response OmpR family regulator
MATKKPLVLLANDDPGLLRLFSRVLELEGCRVVTAHDSATALELAKKKQLALIILEFKAVAAVIELCRCLRQFSSTPIIAMGSKYDLMRCLEAGANDFILKPVSVGKFVTCIKAALRRPAS